MAAVKGKIAIDWKEPRLHIIGAGGKKDCVHGEVVLLPGVNIVDRATWKKIRENEIPVIEGYVTDGVIEEIGESEDKETDLSDVLPKTPASALKMVRATFALPQLEKWLVGETRPPVKEALTNQITAVIAAKRDDNSKTEE